jgi:CheY-like chemotaxis protein
MTHILYIEDDKALADSYIPFLEDMNYTVDCPAGEGEALKQAMLLALANTERRYDVIVMDLHLTPGTYGNPYDKRLRQAIIDYKKKQNPGLIWLILSGTANLDEARAMYPEANQVYFKPRCSGTVLVQVITDLLAP